MFQGAGGFPGGDSGTKAPLSGSSTFRVLCIHCWMAKEIWKPEMGGVGWEGRFGVMHTTSTHIHWMQLSHLTDPTAGKTGKWSYFCDQEGKKKKTGKGLTESV